MFPHERSLVKRLESAPFALIGVNSDMDLNLIKEKNKEAQITWRSFWDGPKGMEGPIAKDFRVRGWPTLYLIDHMGVIRFKDVHAEALDKAIDELVTKARK